MKILGIDPGTATTGFGCIEVTDISAISGKGLQVIEWGLIETSKELLKEERLEIIFERTLKLIEKFNPDVFVAEYAPGTIKKLITGSGRANKKEVQLHVRKILGNKVKSEKRKKTHFDNAADALAIAMTHAMKMVEEKTV